MKLISILAKKLFVLQLAIGILAVRLNSYAQSATQIINKFNTFHNQIKAYNCIDGQLLTNRAMNLFFADRVGYYLADPENLTFCKNNVTLNTGSGSLSMSHSLFEPNGNDEPVKSYQVIGVKTNVFNAYQAAANKAAFNNELGFTFKHFWVSKPKTWLNNCDAKYVLDAKREIILKNITSEIAKKSAEFEISLGEMANLTESNNKELRHDFYKNIEKEYTRKFAEMQYRSLFDLLRYKKLTAHWTNFNLYAPLIFQRFTVAENIAGNFKIKKTYPAEISISHTRFLETQKAAKFYLNFRAGILMNNSINCGLFSWTNIETYRNLGGKNISYLADKQLDRLFIGNFRHFITPNIKTQMVFFPPENHFGISATIEQNFGKFKALNGTIGIPIVLIDKQSAPMTNLEIQIKYFDMTNTLNNGRNIRDNVSINITWGQPIGRNVF